MSGARYQSLTLVLDVAEVLECGAALAAHSRSLEQGWAALPGLHTACLALLPPLAAGGSGALLLECSFEGDLRAFAEALYAGAGAPLRAVLRHGEVQGALASAADWARFLSERAQRAVPFVETGAAEPELQLLRWLRAQLDALRLCWLPRSLQRSTVSVEALEERRSAVGLQEPQRGVPLLHVAWLAADSVSGVKRALRDVELERARLERGARFLLRGERLLFLAYPRERALGWSERVSQQALFTLARVWMNTRGFGSMAWMRRSRRERRLQGFLLDGRVPVGAWFNAEPLLRRA